MLTGTPRTAPPGLLTPPPTTPLLVLSAEPGGSGNFIQNTATNPGRPGGPAQGWAPVSRHRKGLGGGQGAGKLQTLGWLGLGTRTLATPAPPGRPFPERPLSGEGSETIWAGKEGFLEEAAWKRRPEG